ncbi:acyl-CoA N-acyltransferase [Trichoderma evansii]
MASVKLRPAQPADATAIANTHYRALDQYHEFYGAFFVLDPREILAKSTPLALEKPENTMLVAVDEESSDVVGIVKYTIEAEKLPSAATVAGDSTPAPAGPSLTAVKAHLKELWDEFGKRRDEMDECYEKAADGKRHIYIHTLMINPDYQRRGVGGRLLAAVLKQSDEEGIPTFLASTAESIGLYSRNGFESLGTWPIDNEYWAGRIVDLEKELGIAGHEGLQETFKGAREVEDVMVRWPKKQ